MNKYVLLSLLIFALVIMIKITVNAENEDVRSLPMDLDKNSYRLYKNETKTMPLPSAYLTGKDRETFIDKVLSQGPIRKEKAVPDFEFPDVEKTDKNKRFPDSEYFNEYGAPIGDGEVEANIFDGLDNDNDGVIDEGYAPNLVQIVVQDVGKSKDDEFELSVDGISLGKNIGGRTRFWNIRMSDGIHKISLKGINIPDGIGTYRIWFANCKLKSGFPLQGIISQGDLLKWTVESGPTHPPHSDSE